MDRTIENGGQQLHQVGKSKAKISKRSFLQKMLCEYEPIKNVVITGHEVNNSLMLLIDILSKNVPFSEYYKKVQLIMSNYNNMIDNDDNDTKIDKSDIIDNSKNGKTSDNIIGNFDYKIVEYGLGKTWIKYHFYDTNLSGDCYNKIQNNKRLVNDINVIVFIVDCPYCHSTNYGGKSRHKNNHHTMNVLKDTTTISKNLILNYIMLGIPIIIAIEHYNYNISIKNTSFYYNQFFDINATSNSQYQLKNQDTLLVNRSNLCEWICCTNETKESYDNNFIQLVGLSDIKNNAHFCYGSDPKYATIPQSKKHVQLVHISTQSGYNLDHFISILQKKVISKKS